MSARPTVAAPRGRAPAVTAALGCALVLTTLGVLVVVDAVLVLSGPHELVLGRMVRGLDGRGASTLTTAIGGLVLVLGLLLLAAALRPRAHTHLPVRAGSDIWLTPTAVAALAAHAAEREPGVLEATVDRVHRRKVVIEVLPRQPDAALAGTVQTVLRHRLAPIDGAAIDVRTREDR